MFLSQRRSAPLQRKSRKMQQVAFGNVAEPPITTLPCVSGAPRPATFTAAPPPCSCGACSSRVARLRGWGSALRVLGAPSSAQADPQSFQAFPLAISPPYTARHACGSCAKLSYIYIYATPPKIYAFLLFDVLCRLRPSTNDVRPVRLLTYTYMLPPSTPIDSCNSHLSAAAAVATTTTTPTTSIKMVTPNPGPTSTM